jgi:hypothetical protein
MKLLLTHILQFPFISSVLDFDIFLKSFYSEVTKLCPSGNINDQLLCDIESAVFHPN